MDSGSLIATSICERIEPPASDPKNTFVTSQYQYHTAMRLSSSPFEAATDSESAQR